MNPERLAELIKTPWNIKEDEVALLRNVVDSYPFFTSARLLYLYAAWRYDRVNYDKHLADIPTLSVSPLQINYWLKTEPVLEDGSLNQNIDSIQNEPLTPNVNQTSQTDLKNVGSVENILNENKNSDELDILNNQVFLDTQKSLNELETLTANNSDSKVNDNGLINEDLPGNPILKNDTDKNETACEEKKNFLDWLKTCQKQPENIKGPNIQYDNGNKEAKPVSDSKLKKRKKQWDLLDKIIENEPGPIKIKTAESTPVFYQSEKAARESLLESEELVTETLANIYLAQGYYFKAIRVFEILSLKIPQKNAYFAEKIKEIKNKLKSKEL